jgi:hypothetical protein
MQPFQGWIVRSFTISQGWSPSRPGTTAAVVLGWMMESLRDMRFHVAH